MARRPNLIVVRATDASVHERWLGSGARNFDLMVSYSGDHAGRYNQGVEYYNAMKGPQSSACHALFTQYMKLVGDYERVAIVCDDIDANARIWDTLFHCCDWYGLDLAHPAVVGHASTDITTPRDGCILRYMDALDSLAPIFARRALERVLPTFVESIPEGELPAAWSRLLPWPEYRSAIVDTVKVTRTIAAWGSPARPTLKAREHARLRLVHEEPQGETR